MNYALQEVNSTLLVQRLPLLEHFKAEFTDRATGLFWTWFEDNKARHLQMNIEVSDFMMRLMYATEESAGGNISYFDDQYNLFW